MRVLYDSNVLIRYLAGDERARVLIEKVASGEWEGYITDVVASEVIYVYLRLALDVPRYELKNNSRPERESQGPPRGRCGASPLTLQHGNSGP